jgi:hypothetical protein
MNQLAHHLTTVALLLAIAPLGAAPASAQYGQAYEQMLKTNPGIGGGTNRYMYDKYFRSNPNVSPYLSGALLGGNDAGNAYSAVVRPEMQARQATQTAQSNYIAQRKLEGNVGYTANPGATFYGAPTGYQYGKPVPAARRNSGAYQNHWYGSWNK